jgi:methionyl aminopeptidase
MSAVSPDQSGGDNDADSATQAPKQNGATGPNVKSGDLENSNSDDDDGEDGDAGQVNGGGEGGGKKKKKRKPRKKKKAGAAKGQTSPPTVKVSDLFPNDTYPIGEEVEYKNENSYRTTSEEKKHMDRMNPDFLSDYRQAAEVHKQVRKHAHSAIKPGMTLTEICEMIETGVRSLTGHPGLEEGDNLKAGVAFPTGVNLDHIAAHYSPNAGNKTVLKEEHVMKVDFGVHVNGRIVDSAWTVAFQPQYDNLLAAVKDATNTGVRSAGIDARLGEIGADIQEAMESYEVTINGQTYPVKSIRNLNGR